MGSDPEMSTANSQSARGEQAQQGAVRFEPRRLASIRGKDYLVRFSFGFLISVVAAVVGETAGARVGGLFLAFPAILPATLTLVEQKDGLGQALSDVRGATLGALGMVAFAVVMVVSVRHVPALALIGALLAWVVVSALAYLFVRALVKALGEKQYLPEIPTSAAASLITTLRRKSLTVATAESCTGGMVSALLCSVPDAKRVVLGGVAAYTDELKVALLGVSRATLSSHGAISAEVAAEMAMGVQRRTGADLAIAITGATGTPANGQPAGTTFIAVVDTTRAPLVRRFASDLGAGRNDERAVRMALQLGESMLAGANAAALPGEPVSVGSAPPRQQEPNR
jgi:nicotinamide-nucleotide amidase